MFIITNKEDLRKKWEDLGLDAYSDKTMNTTTDFILAKYQKPNLRSFRVERGTRSGSCVVLGAGPTAVGIKGCQLPVFAINRSIQLCTPEFWCVHDPDAFESFLDPLDNKKTTIVTQPGNLIGTPILQELNVMLVDVESDPRRYLARKVLHWNQTTAGWAIHLAEYMGFETIYLLGMELTSGGYVNPNHNEASLVHNHRGVRERMLEMFDHQEMWHNGRTRIVDLSNGPLPITKESIPWAN